MKSVLEYFKEISKIPRGSCNEKMISDYLVNFAKERKLDCVQDENWNVIIKKDATSGYEKHEAIILQAHIDMVCEKEYNIEHDFEKDGIEIIIDGDAVKAKGTTLGADNGIGVSYILAILDNDNIQHPKLECVFTVQEECGMLGAKTVNVNLLSSRKMISLDGGNQNHITVGSAGNKAINITKKYELNEINNSFQTYEISIFGLRGGHSGNDINKGLANSIVVTKKLLILLKEKIKFNLVKLEAGDKLNAIPTSSSFIITTDADIEDIKNICTKFQFQCIDEMIKADKDIKIIVKKVSVKYNKCLGQVAVNEIIDIIDKIPVGAYSINEKFNNPEISVNIPKLTIDNGNLNLRVRIRNNTEEKIDILKASIEKISKQNNMDFEFISGIPHTEYVENSELIEIGKKVYKELNKKDLLIHCTHAGLEMGYFRQRIKDLDIIVFGPNIFNMHSPSECTSIKSINNTFEFLKGIIRSI